MSDSAIVELRGRHRLIAELLEAGLEIAQPIRDRGVDLIAYDEREHDFFVACPIQLKASSGEHFSYNAKYMKTKGLIVAFVWNLDQPTEARTYALTCDEIERVGAEMGYAASPSWERGSYSVNRRNMKLTQRLEEFLMTTPAGRADPAKWRTKIRGSAREFQTG
jgi:hypothetical protein